MKIDELYIEFAKEKLAEFGDYHIIEVPLEKDDFTIYWEDYLKQILWECYSDDLEGYVHEDIRKNINCDIEEEHIRKGNEDESDGGMWFLRQKGDNRVCYQVIYDVKNKMIRINKIYEE